MPSVCIDADKVELLQLLDAKVKRQRENWLANYKPYPKQMEFHNAGKEHRERLFMAANQCGKSLSGGAEVAMHLTGLYPDWWNGHRTTHPVKWWASSVTGEATRDNPQRVLVGHPADESSWGTGAIPKDKIIDVRRSSHGCKDSIDTVLVEHISGATSFVSFKSYVQGREKWQGPTLDGVWFDEEPPMEIYSEGLTRTNATKGIVMLTFTPLLGMSDVVRVFLDGEKK